MPFQIIRNDITKMETDAVVNSTNREPFYGRGSDYALYLAAGAEALLTARKKIGEIAPGSAAMTKGFALPARYIIHTVVPSYEEDASKAQKSLEACYDACLQLAKRKRLKSIAFPLLGAGTLGYPRELALSIALSCIQRFLMESEMTVWLVVFDRESVRLSEKISAGIDAYIDDHYVERREEEEYAPKPNFNINLPGALNRDDRPSALHGAASAHMASYAMPSAAPHEAELPKPSAAHDSKADHRKRTLEELLGELDENFQQTLMRIIRERDLDEVEVYKRANLDRKVFSRIRSHVDYMPSRNTAIALAIGLKLNLDEARDLLSRAGFTFSPGRRADVIIEYFIENGVYDVMLIDTALFEHGEQPLSRYT